MEIADSVECFFILPTHITRYVIRSETEPNQLFILLTIFYNHDKRFGIKVIYLETMTRTSHSIILLLVVSVEISTDCVNVCVYVSM